MFHCVRFGTAASVNGNWLRTHLCRKVMRRFIHSLAHDGAPFHLRLAACTVTTTHPSQQQAAVLLGYTQVSWDNASGKEAQPASASTKWTDLSFAEKSSATALGYTASTWSTSSATKNTPWSDLTATAGGDVCYITFDFVE